MSKSFIRSALKGYAWVPVAILGCLMSYHAIYGVQIHGKVSEHLPEQAGQTLVQANLLKHAYDLKSTNNPNDHRAIWSKNQLLAATTIVYRHDQNTYGAMLDEELVAVNQCLAEWHSMCLTYHLDENTGVPAFKPCEKLEAAGGIDIRVEEAGATQLQSQLILSNLKSCEGGWPWTQLSWLPWSAPTKIGIDLAFGLNGCRQFTVGQRKWLLSTLINELQGLVQHQTEQADRRRADLITIHQKLEAQTEKQIATVGTSSDAQLYWYPPGKAAVVQECRNLLQNSGSTTAKLLEQDNQMSQLLAHATGLQRSLRTWKAGTILKVEGQG